MTETLKTDLTKGIFTVELNRPEVRNAFNDKLIYDLQDTFDKIANDSKIRVVVIKGAGRVFCAGGDLKWMQESINVTDRDNLEDTRKLAHMFETLDTCPKPVVGLVHGAVIGGGVGLASICDYVIASRETVFSLAEVRLGIIPACIGPFVISKIGESHARAYFMSAERFPAERAHAIGLVHEVVDTPEALATSCERITKNLLQCGPNAMTAAKKLVRDLRGMPRERGLEYVAKTLADLRVTPEGQEGLRAFLEKRKPNWIS